ncbi:MAG: 30S ribosomal protein S16 [Candidatus Cloacimonetes bacterium]|nr:30S ribosomal protein S16 [Candidatus Cloacimonadota bacterium]
MVKLRLKRMGTIDKPFYRIVAVDSRKKRDGAYLESLGYYDPKTDPLTLKVDMEKAINWLKVGAQPSDTVRSLFRKAGVMQKWHNIRFGVKAEESKPEKKKVTKPAEKKTIKKAKSSVKKKPVKKVTKPVVKKVVKKKPVEKKPVEKKPVEKKPVEKKKTEKETKK